MDLLSWNCRGLGQPRTVQELVTLTRMHSPKLIFLSETRQNSEYVRRLRWRLGLKECFAVKGEVSPPENHRGPRPKRYETFWEREEELSEEIKTAWLHTQPVQHLGDVVTKLSATMSALHTWSREKIGSISRKLEDHRKRIEQLQRTASDGNSGEIKKLQWEMDELLYKEEMMWLQRSRISWLREGDRNTSFFHRKAVYRSKKNKIQKLKNSVGRWIDKDVELEALATGFFQKLYSRDVNVEPVQVIELFDRVITPDMNEALCRNFSEQEIGDALFQIGPLKAPGPDGFPARFFQRNWEVLKQDVICAVRKFFDDGIMPEGVNDTFIVLIPKKNDPEELKDFRPISLCNVIYKVISKCMVNRMRPLMQDFICPTQSAFIPGRMITDNALIAFECIHTLQKNKGAQGEFCAYKLDLAKAYDRVDWSFLEEILLRLGFHRQWVQWILTCVTTVRYSVCLNGHLLAPFSPSRGLRQGDPLSPYLFLFVADGLSRILQHETLSGHLQELRICQGAPGVSHLLFADDSLLFFKANQEQALVVKNAILKFKRSTGQLLSNAKCSIMFGNACTDVVQKEVKEVLTVQQGGFEEKYLGLPTPQGRMKNDRFQSIRDKFNKRLTNWAEKYLSSGGKEVLIKSVMQALPTYIMGVFKLSSTLCENLMQLVRNFWWGDEQNQRKLHWIGWGKLIMPKMHGGLGFRDFKLFNQALLARQAWRLIQNPNSLCARLLKARYFPNGPLHDTVFPAGGSPSWSGVVHGLELLKKGLIWRVATGEKVHIWRDNWLPRNGALKITSQPNSQRVRRVSQLILPGTRNWDAVTIRSLFLPHDAYEILQLKLPNTCYEDFQAWHYERNGIFTVRSAYKLALREQFPAPEATSIHGDGEQKIWESIWKANVPTKVRIFAWRLAREGLATQKGRYRRSLCPMATCEICGNGEEDGFHAVVLCTKSRALREALRQHWSLPDEIELRYTGPNWLPLLLDNLNNEMCTQTLMLLWRAWHLRNDIIYGKGEATIGASVAFLRSYVQSLLGVRLQECIDKGKNLVTGSHTVLDVGLRKCWSAPPQGWVKLNCDASFDSVSGASTCGIIIRSCRGQVLIAAWSILPACASATEAEILAALEGAKLLVDWISQPVIFESDCAAVIQGLSNSSLNRSHMGLVYREIKDLLNSLWGILIRKVNRECNRVAHELAQLAKRSAGSAVSHLHAPPCVSELLANDCNSTTFV
ncbi:uncharacterized protein LOC133890399 [Phragmites australis]|uniref:uncharacterized protein LOC133890399 n=1 Tax=Phragmites australis TaxID=29695 RepID=UPI002D79A54E|nr:uncharacterized protein LOC133890399 [Phragmites australis]